MSDFSEVPGVKQDVPRRYGVPHVVGFVVRVGHTDKTNLRTAGYICYDNHQTVTEVPIAATLRSTCWVYHTSLITTIYD